VNTNYEDEDEIANWKLDVNEMKKMTGFGMYADEELESIIDSLVKLAIIGYYGNEKKIDNE
jgi:hypothetical protein